MFVSDTMLSGFGSRRDLRKAEGVNIIKTLKNFSKNYYNDINGVFRKYVRIFHLVVIKLEYYIMK